jgi:hypothetical protein
MSALSELDTLCQGHGEAVRLVIGGGFVSVGACVLLTVPSVRDFCGPRLREALRAASESLLQGGTPPA